MIKVYVMETCPDCRAVKELAKTDPRFELVDLGHHVRNLKEFLRLRDTSPAFAPVRARGSIGIPCFVYDDGHVGFAIPEVPKGTSDTVSPGEAPSGEACSLDGKGC